MNRTEKRQQAREQTKKLGKLLDAANRRRMRYRSKKADGKKVPGWVEIV